MTSYDRYVIRELSRRQFLRKAGVLTVTVGSVPTLLAACGDDDEAPETAAQSTGTPGPATVPKASGTVDFLSWEGYDIPNAMKAWKKENGVDVKATYIGNHDDIQAKLKAGGGGGYDLITYYQGYKPLYAELEILQPIDEQKIPNLAGLFPYFAGDEGGFWKNEDGTRTGVPWTWGSIGITYDSAKVDEMSSWYDLLDPKFKGKIAAPDDPTGAWALATHILGLDPAAVPTGEKQKVRDLLDQVAAQTNGISASFGDMTTRLTSGDAVACWQGWAAMNTFAVDAGVKTIKTNVPKEGSFSFCDSYAIPPTTDNADTVHAWINESLSPAVHAQAAVDLVGGVTVADAVAELPKAVAELYSYDDLEGLLERAPFYNNPPTQSDEFVTFEEVLKMWQEVKASAG